MKKEMEGKRFGIFLNECRTEKGITLERLAEGLCSSSWLAKFEKGERSVGKAMRDRLIYRLGIAPEIYEQFLFAEEYRGWKERQQLLYAIARQDVGVAGWLLDRYREKYVDRQKNGVEKRLEGQFCLAMKAVLLEKEDTGGAGKEALQEKLGTLFLEALGLTVALPEPGRIGEKVYAIQELNLMLETVHYGRFQDKEYYYREILHVVEWYGYDQVSLAKICPKTVYYLCRDGVASGKWGLDEKKEAMTLCVVAVECLRKVGRMYYLWELLGMAERLFADVAARQRATGVAGRMEWLEVRIAEYKEWRESLEEVHAEFGVPIETRDFCWMYEEKETYCLNEIIRIRREMLGISRKRLCGSVLCSERTLARLEGGKGGKVQREILDGLMGELGLSAQYCRTELVTSNPEAVGLMSELRGRLRNRECERSDLLLEQIKERISMEVPSNR